MKKQVIAILLFLSFYSAFSQNFTPGNLVISRYGDGTQELIEESIAVPAFLDEFDLAGNKVQTIAFPVVKSEETRNRVLTGGVAGNGQSLLTLSPNGRYLVAIGHNREPGNQYSGKTQKTVGIVTSDCHINIFTAVRPNIGTPRCAITNNGFNIWAVGTGGGLKYKARNTGAANDQVISKPPVAHNSVYIYNNQLYYTSSYEASATGPKIGVVGEGLPNEDLQTVTNLPGFPTNSAPGQMVMLNHDANTPEPDLLYVTDLNKGDLQKWVFDGAKWQAQGSVSIQGVTDGIRGLTGDISSGNVVLYTNTSDAVIKFSDTNAISSTFSEEANTYEVLATAPDNTMFTGVSFTPGTAKKSPAKITSSGNFASLIQENTDLIKDIKANETYQRYPGVEETNLSYISNNDVPVALFFLKVNLANPKTNIEILTPYNKTEFNRQTVREMISYKNAADQEYQVIAASNGDYFSWTGEPDGVVHKNGVIVKEFPDNKFFFGVKDNGTALIGDDRNYNADKSMLKEAVGGRFLLMQYGEITTDHLLDDSIEPRTTAGFLSPDHVVFMWVDGRRTGHSAGLSLRDMASIYRAIGATDAINLDGGGSTTFLMRSIDGSYETRNRPSDNSERAVANGLAVMMKSEVLKATSANAINNNADALIFPNPVENGFSILIEKEKDNPNLQFSLINISGRNELSINGSLDDINEQVNKKLSTLKPGIYIIKVKSGKNTYSARFIKE